MPVKLKKLLKKSLTDRQRQLILAYAENNMNKTKTTNSLFLAKSAINYHFEKIRENTGYDPNKFYDLLELLYIISSEEHVEQEEAV